VARTGAHLQYKVKGETQAVARLTSNLAPKQQQAQLRKSALKTAVERKKLFTHAAKIKNHVVANLDIDPNVLFHLRKK